MVLSDERNQLARYYPGGTFATLAMYIPVANVTKVQKSNICYPDVTFATLAMDISVAKVARVQKWNIYYRGMTFAILVIYYI